MSDIQPSTIVYVASFAALLGALSMGFSLGYSSPAIDRMKYDNCANYNCTGKIDGDNSTILSNNSDERKRQESLIGSMLNIGALVGGILGEPCNVHLGRRLSLIVYGIPFVVGWIVIASSKSVTTVVIGRIITGFCCGLVSQTAPTYVVEIAPPSIRGMLGTCFQVMVTIGILFAPIFSTFLSWRWLAIACSISSVAMSFLMIWMPETPQWLLSKGKNPEAEASLKQFRANQINEEFATMSQASENNLNTESAYSCATIKSRQFLKPFILAMGLMFFQQFSGINGILFYQATIFEKAAPNFAPIQATITVCVAQVIATIIGSLLVDRLGRRVLLFASGVGHAVSLGLFGYYEYKKHNDLSYANDHAWIALVSIIMFVCSFSIGYGPIPWMMIPELSSAKVRSLIASIGTAFNWTCSYIVTANMKGIEDAIGTSYTYWMFALICASSCVFVFLLLPETKGRSEEQIQTQLLGETTGAHELGSKRAEGSFKQVA